MSYTNRKYVKELLSKIDIRVFLVFILVILIGLFIFLYQRYNYVDCSKIEFLIDAQRRQVGEVIEFYDKTPDAKSWKWDFGDNSKKEYTKNPLHKYENPGIYTVTLEVNNSCRLQKIIEIRDLGKIIDSMKVPKIISPQVVTAGTPVEFYYNYKGVAFSWEWSFGESGQMDNTSEFPAYMYSTPGLKKVTLIVNGDVAHIATRDVYVKPRRLTVTKIDTIKSYVYAKEPKMFELPLGDPQEDPLEEMLRDIPAVPVESPIQDKVQKAPEEKASDISEYQFELQLLEVAKQSKTNEDFAKYVCNGYDFPVVKNGKQMMTFSEFCKQLGGKTIKIESLRLKKNNRNCIVGLTINYKIKKLMVWVKD